MSANKSADGSVLEKQDRAFSTAPSGTTRTPLPRSAFDAEGFLRELSRWNPTVAEQIAGGEGIDLTPAHWEILQLLRDYYSEFDTSPAMRALVKYCASVLGAEKGRSIYLLSLFPGSPAKLGCKIAGLPRPDNCL